MADKKGVSGVTKTGFRFNVPQYRLENYELIEAIGELDDKPQTLPKVVNLLLGEDQAKLLKDHIRDKETGIVDVNKLSTEITQIFAVQEIKN